MAHQKQPTVFIDNFIDIRFNMSTRSLSSYFPNLGSNAVVQLIIVLGVAFVSLGLLHAVMYIVYVKPGVITDAIFADNILANIAVGNIYNFPTHFWDTIPPLGCSTPVFGNCSVT